MLDLDLDGVGFVVVGDGFGVGVLAEFADFLLGVVVGCVAVVVFEVEVLFDGCLCLVDVGGGVVQVVLEFGVCVFAHCVAERCLVGVVDYLVGCVEELVCLEVCWQCFVSLAEVEHVYLAGVLPVAWNGCESLSV